MTGDPICPDCGRYLANTRDYQGTHVCITGAASTSYVTVGTYAIAWSDWEVLIDTDCRVNELQLKRWQITREHWARYPQKGKRAKRMKAGNYGTY
jgi:hypothetical protein